VAKAKKRSKPRLYTAADIKLLKQHSKARTPVSRVAKIMKRSVGSFATEGFEAWDWSRSSAVNYAGREIMLMSTA
jgi:hypothetical protein